MSAIIALGAGVSLFCILILLLGPQAQKREKIQSRLDDLGGDVFRSDMLRD